jgi:SAM-dependent methyltransferase
MESVSTNYFDGPVAEGYDSDAEIFAPAVVDPVVDFLADLAGTGSALELAIGTGRIGLPLSQRGVTVHGIELSPAMVAQLKAKPGAEDIPVTIGDFATAKAEGTFRLAFLVYNTIENLTTQDEQVECFCNVARHLEPGGCFVIEVEVPPLQRLPVGEKVRAFTVEPPHLGFDELDVATQRGVSHHYWVVDGRGRARPDGAYCRYEVARTLGRLETGALHHPQREAHFSVGEAVAFEEGESLH